MRLGEVLGTQAMLATVVAVAAACDIIREDAGLIAAIVVGLGLANLPGFDIPARRPFFETVIQLIIGVLFVSISASVTPDSLKGLVLPTLGLVAVLVLVARPLAALVATLWTSLSRGERGFIGWMAPRGIVAASTATILSATLVADGIGGAEDILPVTFLVIVMTVTLYGLTAAPAARLLGVMRSARTRPLLVGGVPRVVDLGRALQSAGLEVLMWAGLQDQRDQLTSAGLERASGELLATATSRGAELEGVTAVLLLTDEDDFNALASATLQANLGRAGLPRTGPPRQPRRCRPLHRRRGALRRPLTGVAINKRHHQGAGIVTWPAEGGIPDGYDVLFVVRPDGQLVAVTKHEGPAPERGDTLVLLGPATRAATAATASPTVTD